MAPRRWSRRGRFAAVTALGAVALVISTATLSAVAGTSDDPPAEEETGYVGGPSYLDPAVIPYDLPVSLETINVPPVELISRRSDVPGDVSGGTEPSMSADGRYVVFTTVVAGSDSLTTVLMRDRGTGDLYEITPQLPGFPGRSSRSPVISADGCVVAVATTIPYDVFRDDDDGEGWDVYRQFMPQCSANPDEGGGEWELMSTADDGDTSALNTVDPAASIAVSAGGSVVAFRSVPPGRFAGPDPVGELFVADATVALGSPDRVSRVPGLPAEPAGGQFRVSGHRDPGLSADGRWVTFVSDATASSTPPTWADGREPGGPALTQVYAWDRAGTSGPPVAMSVDELGRPLARGASQPAISPDGRLVTFVANAVLAEAGLEGECSACPANVFVRDRDTNGDGLLDEAGASTTRAVSVADGVLGDADSASPVFALDGRMVAFLTAARNLAPGAVGTASAVVVADTVTGTVSVRTSESGGTRPAAVATGSIAVSANGRSLALETAVPAVLGASVVSGTDTQIVAVTTTPAVRVDDVDLGTTFVNVQTQRSTTVSNAGPGAFVPASIASTSPAFVVAGGSCQVGTPVPPGSSCTVDLLFSASALGFSSSQLVVSEQGVAAITVAANVTAAGGVPKIESEPSTLVYAESLAGQVGETLAVNVRNVGNGPTIITGVVLGGTHPADFAVDTDECTGRTLADLSACVIRVWFQPTTSGVRSAVLVVTAADGAVTRTTLSGRGEYQPMLTVTPTRLEAGSWVVLSGSGYPADIDVNVAWEGSRSQLARTDATGSFTLRWSSAGVAAGTRRVVVADAVPAGATARFEPVRSDPVVIEETGSGLDAANPAFD